MLSWAALALLSTFLATGAQVSAQSISDAPPAAFRIGGVEILDSGPEMVSLGAGAFNVIPNDFDEDTEAELRLEYRVGEKWYGIGTMAGVLVNTDGGLFGYAALYTDLRIGERWIVTPAAGVGAYDASGGKDLGGTFQFHLGLDVAYRFDQGDRLGLKMAHIRHSRLRTWCRIRPHHLQHSTGPADRPVAGAGQEERAS